MLEGLEANEQRLSDLGSTARIDSEFFRKHYLVALDKASNANAQTLEDVSSAVIHPTEVERVYSDTGIQILLAQNVRDNIFDFSNEAFMPDAMRSILAANLVQYDDVVLTRSGANYGQCACFKHRWPIYACADVLVIRPRNIAGGYLCTFLNTSYGKALVERGAYGAAQPHVAPPYLRSLPIPRFPGLEDKVDKVIQASVDVVASGRKIYAEAETLLLRSLGLEDWQPPEPLAYESTFAQAWGDGRLDAEHFQPKYQWAHDALAALKPLKFLPLDSMLHEITNGQTPLRHDLSDGDIPFLTAEHVSDFRINYASDKRVLSEHHSSLLRKTKLQEQDILITIKGRIGNAAVVKDLPGPVNINQDVGLLRLKEQYNPYYVVGFLNSAAGKAFTEQVSTGQINPFLGLGNLKTVLIPIFTDERMNEIGEAIRATLDQARNAQERASRLLEAAKRAVEVAIEDGEASGMAVLEGLREKWV